MEYKEYGTKNNDIIIWLYQQNGEHILILYEYMDSNNDPAAL